MKPTPLKIEPNVYYRPGEAAALLKMDSRVFKILVEQKLKEGKITIIPMIKGFRVLGAELLKIGGIKVQPLTLLLEDVKEEEVMDALNKFLAKKGLSLDIKKLSTRKRALFIDK